MAVLWLDLARYADTVGHPHGCRPLDLAVARLGARRLPRQPALRSLRDRADRGRSPARGHGRPAHGFGLQPQPRHHGRGRRHRRRVPGGIRRGSHGHDGVGVPGADPGLRALPRAQVRSDQSGRVLPFLRVLQLERGAGTVFPGARRQAGPGTVHLGAVGEGPCPDRRAGGAGRARARGPGGEGPRRSQRAQRVPGRPRAHERGRLGPVHDPRGPFGRGRGVHARRAAGRFGAGGRRESGHGGGARCVTLSHARDRTCA
jgi:hypothetical protein